MGKLHPSSLANPPCPSPLSLPPYPKSGILKGATHQMAQGCYHLPGSPQNPRESYLSSPGQTAWDHPCPPISLKCTALSQKSTVRFNLPDPVDPQNVFSEVQDGRHYVAVPTTVLLPMILFLLLPKTLFSLQLTPSGPLTFLPVSFHLPQSLLQHP